MHMHIVSLRRKLLAIIIGAMLTACGAVAAPVSSVPSPATALPTAAPSPAPMARSAPSIEQSPVPGTSVLPSPTVSAAPRASTMPRLAERGLPAPLLFLRAGQIVRMERDGQTITPLTHEQPGLPNMLAVIDFDVSPLDGSVVYIVQAPDGNMLVRTDAAGQHRTVLLTKTFITNLRWSPDGTRIAVQISDPPEISTELAGGVYLISANGGAPQLLQPNDRNDRATPSPDARGYMPHAWSPDGKQLLLSAYGLSVDVCSAAVKDLAMGTLIPIQAPMGMVSGCASGQWSVDGRTIYIGMARPGPQPPVPGLWQADPKTGAITPYLQGEFEVGGYQLVTNYRPLKNGGVYAFVSTVKQLPHPLSGVVVPYKLWQGSQTDGLFLRDEYFSVVGQALWATDTSGVVVDMPNANTGTIITAWIPVNGDPVVVLGTFMGEIKHWARNELRH